MLYYSPVGNNLNFMYLNVLSVNVRPLRPYFFFHDVKSTWWWPTRPEYVVDYNGMCSVLKFVFTLRVNRDIYEQLNSMETPKFPVDICYSPHYSSAHTLSAVCVITSHMWMCFAFFLPLLQVNGPRQYLIRLVSYRNGMDKAMKLGSFISLNES